jgi:hypothetical protein
MAQRSYTNDRYRKDAKIGSTRKSAAAAKPVRKHGTVSSSAPSSKPKAKKKPEGNRDWSGLPSSPEIKKWRRIWWALLLGGLALIGLGYVIPQIQTNDNAQRIIAAVVLAASLTAVSIDVFIIRKLRKQLIEAEKASHKKKGDKHGAAEKGASKRAEKPGSTDTDAS